MLTLVMTTSKRLDYFKRTLLSFNDNFQDKHLFTHKIIIDDSSCIADRQAMMKMCRGWEFIFHNRRSHAQSIILMQGTVRTKYYFILEDDWIFLEKQPFATLCLDKMRQHKEVGLISLMQSGPVDKNNILIPPTDKDWPGWTLLPGMHDSTKEGMYRDVHCHEKTFAENYEHKIAYLGRTFISHIGEITAYSLNGSSR